LQNTINTPLWEEIKPFVDTIFLFKKYYILFSFSH